jgi:hypothetical protein
LFSPETWVVGYVTGIITRRSHGKEANDHPIAKECEAAQGRNEEKNGEEKNRQADCSKGEAQIAGEEAAGRASVGETGRGDAG